MRFHNKAARLVIQVILEFYSQINVYANMAITIITLHKSVIDAVISVKIALNLLLNA